VFTSPRLAVANEIIPMANELAVDDECVNVHRYHPSRPEVIVDAMTPALLLTWQVSRLKLTKMLESLPTKICAKILVPRLRYTLTVLIIEDGAKHGLRT